MKIEPVAAPDPITCPHCAEPLPYSTFDGAETLDNRLNTLDQSVYSGHLIWGSCGKCGETVYGVEVGIASTERPGLVLIIDHSHKADSRQLYRVTWKSRTWIVEHFTGVSGVSYESSTGAPLDWLDIHHLHYFAADDTSPFDTAHVFLKTYTPDLARLWDGNLRPD